MEGDWRRLVSSADAEAIEQANRLLSAYEAVEGADWGSMAPEPPDRPHTARGDCKASGASTPSVEDGGEMSDDEDDDEMQEGLFAFQRRTSAHPEQALRYNRDPRGTPLWAGAKGRPPPGAPPPCERCGAARTFECQLMPQLICALETAAEWVDEDEASSSSVAASGAPQPATVDALRSVAGGADDADALDWGVVAVYSCSASCALPNEQGECGYAQEWLWHQPLA